MFKFLEIGHHPWARITIRRFCHRGWKNVREHYRECEDNCFQRMFWGNVVHAFGIMALFATILTTVFLHPTPIHLTLSSLLLLWGWTMILLARFATHTYSYEDLVEEIEGTSTKRRELKNRVEGTLKTGKIPPEMLEVIKQATGAIDAKVVSTMGDGDLGGFVIELTKPNKSSSAQKNEGDTVAAAIKETQEKLAKEQARRRRGGGGEVS